jgi:hypothetical protein
MPVQKLNRATRDEIYKQTRAAVSAEQPHLSGNCLEFAWHGYHIIRAYTGAPRTIIQAGSASWPRLAVDDGVSPTHVSYEWNPAAEPTCMFRSGLIPLVPRADGHLSASLPEMHVWLACPESEEIIDYVVLPVMWRPPISERNQSRCREPALHNEWSADLLSDKQLAHRHDPPEPTSACRSSARNGHRFSRVGRCHVAATDARNVRHSPPTRGELCEARGFTLPRLNRADSARR